MPVDTIGVAPTTKREDPMTERIDHHDRLLLLLRRGLQLRPGRVRAVLRGRLRGRLPARLLRRLAGAR